MPGPSFDRLRMRLRQRHGARRAVRIGIGVCGKQLGEADGLTAPARTEIPIGWCYRALLRCHQSGHRERDNNVNLMRLLFLPDPPSARSLFRDRTAYGEANVNVRVQHDVSALEQFIEILAGLSEPRR